MKHLLKFSMILFTCLTLTLGATLPSFAAISGSGHKHQTPATEDIAAVYAIDQANQTYHKVQSSEWRRISNALALPTTPVQRENKKSKYIGGFCYELNDGTRKIYTISESQVLVGNVPLLASVSARNTLLNINKKLCRDYPAAPAMLAYMDPNKITRAIFSGYGGTNNHIDTKKWMNIDITRAANSGAVWDFANSLKALTVTSRATNIANVHRLPAATDDTMEITLEFATSTIYQISINNGELSIYSTDGTRTYTYSFPDYDPRRPGKGQDWQLRNEMWDIFCNSGNYSKAAIFMVKPNSMSRIKGAFYSAEDGGQDTMTRLGRILDDIRTDTNFLKIKASTKNFLVVYAQGGNGIERFELDGNQQTAYYIDAYNKGHSVALSDENYAYVKSLLNGRERSNRTVLMEYNGNDKDSLIFTCATTDPIFGELFDENPKAIASANSGKGDYYICWADTGNMISRTVKTDEKVLYYKLDRIFGGR